MDGSPDAKHGWQWFALGSAIFAALTGILGKMGVTEINSNLATFIRTVVILGLTAGVISFRREWEPLGKLSRWGVSMLVLSGLATGLSWLCYYRALQMAPASRVAPIDKLSVALVIILAVVILREDLTWRIALGGTLVLAGVLVLAFD